MPLISDYDVYVFDCDGVILNSNKLKIDAMNVVLKDLEYHQNTIDECLEYFSKNFGKSRFHHVDYFIQHVFGVNRADEQVIREEILRRFSIQCRKLYLNAELTPGVIDFIKSLQGDIFVASGSEQAELRDVFSDRDLSQYFVEVYGSPTRKSKLVENICSKYRGKKVVMVGDAVSDFEASEINNIDFVFYSPFSNVRDTMLELSKQHGFPVLNSYF